MVMLVQTEVIPVGRVTPEEFDGRKFVIIERVFFIQGEESVWNVCNQGDGEKNFIDESDLQLLSRRMS